MQAHLAAPAESRPKRSNIQLPNPRLERDPAAPVSVRFEGDAEAMPFLAEQITTHNLFLRSDFLFRPGTKVRIHIPGKGVAFGSVASTNQRGMQVSLRRHPR